MPLPLESSYPTLVIRKDAFERAHLARQAFDERLSLTADEFRVEGNLVVIGPIHEADAMTSVIAELEDAGLVYFDDFFELSGTWPTWLRVFVRGE